MKQADGYSRCRIWGGEQGVNRCMGNVCLGCFQFVSGELLNGQSRGMLVEPNS